MANFDSINSRHAAVNYLKSDASKVQRTASSTGFFCKSLFISYSISIVHFLLTILLSLFSHIYITPALFSNYSETSEWQASTGLKKFIRY